MVMLTGASFRGMAWSGRSGKVWSAGRVGSGISGPRVPGGAVDNRTPSPPGSVTLPSGAPRPGLGVSPEPRVRPWPEGQITGGGSGPGRRVRPWPVMTADGRGVLASRSDHHLGGSGTGPVTAGVAGRFEGRRGAAGAMVVRSGT